MSILGPRTARRPRLSRAIDAVRRAAARHSALSDARSVVPAAMGSLSDAGRRLVDRARLAWRRWHLGFPGADPQRRTPHRQGRPDRGGPCELGPGGRRATDDRRDRGAGTVARAPADGPVRGARGGVALRRRNRPAGPAAGAAHARRRRVAGGAGGGRRRHRRAPRPDGFDRSDRRPPRAMGGPAHRGRGALGSPMARRDPEMGRALAAGLDRLAPELGERHRRGRRSPPAGSTATIGRPTSSSTTQAT